VVGIRGLRVGGQEGEERKEHDPRILPDRGAVVTRAVSDALPAAFYDRRADVVAPELLGKIVTRGSVALRITEVEAYRQDDSACHAYRGRTARNAPLWGPPGRAYVYLCYGLHHLLNFVCEAEGTAAAVLVRGGEVVGGHALVRRRRGGRLDCDGPGKVGQALGLDVRFTGASLDGALRVVEGEPVAEWTCTPRIGIDYALECHRALPWRFVRA
jgi:DNA-3-methyladenine glycosylase